jgi:hypothetical protein
VVLLPLLLLLGVVVRGNARGLFGSLVVDPHSFSDFFRLDDPVETKKKVGKREGERERERDTHTHTHTHMYTFFYLYPSADIVFVYNPTNFSQLLIQ